MVCPAVKLHELYSIQFFKGLDILFEDLNIVNCNELKKIINTPILPTKCTVNEWFSIDTNTKTIHLQAYMLNATTYFVTREGRGTRIEIPYTCPDKDIRTGLEYLYHMYNNLVVV